MGNSGRVPDDAIKLRRSLPISVVVPVRNAASLIDSCLAAIERNRPAEIIVVDGNSGDGTTSLARNYTKVVLSDGGKGVAHARQMGAEAAQQPYVAFVDVDIELPDGALQDLLDELIEHDLEAIQAAPRSVASDDYWSEALTAHHGGGRSRRWFGLVATVFRRDKFLHYGMDSAFVTGEDIELRYRMERAHARFSVSEKTVVPHRFEKGFAFALGQWLADGTGLGRMARKYGWRVGGMVIIPAGGAVLGIGRSLLRQPKYVPYFCLYAIFNYVGIVRGLLDRGVTRERTGG